MANWKGIGEEIEKEKVPNKLDIVRRRYIAKMHKKTGRNVIAYYSGWLQKPGLNEASINDDDKNAFMTVIHKLNRNKGLDLILHTPGGDLAATESIVDYLCKMFDGNIRTFVPQLAMSGGTMIACASKEIVMGKQSSLGPIDPQFRGLPAHGVIEEFEKAIEETVIEPKKAQIWQTIIGKYHPTFIGECQKAVDLSKIIAEKWLKDNMFKDDNNAGKTVDKILENLNDHSKTMTHSRHISIDKCKEIGLKIVDLETLDQKNDLQDIVLSIHHSYMHTFAMSTAIKIVENQLGTAYIRGAKVNNNRKK